MTATRKQAPVVVCGAAGPRSSADETSQPRGRRLGVRTTDDETRLCRSVGLRLVVAAAAGAPPPTDDHPQQAADKNKRRNRAARPDYRQTDICNS